MPTRRFHRKKSRTIRKSRKTRRMMGGSGYMSVKRADVLMQIPDYLSKDFYILNGSKYKKIGKIQSIRRHVLSFKKNHEVLLNGKNEIYYKYYKSPSSLSSMSMSMSSDY